MQKISFIATVLLALGIAFLQGKPWGDTNKSRLRGLYGAIASSPVSVLPETTQLLTGRQEPQIQVLKGSPSETVRLLFKGGSWIFYPDGKFLFTPSESANVRNDIFPICGTYTKENNLLAFQGERDSSGASASVDGVVHINKNSIVLDVVYTASALDTQRIAKISQILSRQAKSSPVTKIQGIPVPAIFDISLQGKTETQAFNSKPATLKIVPSLPGEPNPFSVILSTASINEVGSLLWQSFASRLSGGGEVVSKVTVNRNQVRLEVDSPPLYGVTWFTIPPGQLVPNLPIGASIKRGTLNFSIQGTSISGEISATGVSDLNKPSTYSARFTGNIQQNSRGGVAPPLPVTNLQTPESSFSGSWSTEGFGLIELRQSGQKVSGTYTGRGGGTIAGIVQGNRLDFNWKEPEKREGWGFLEQFQVGEH